MVCMALNRSERRGRDVPQQELMSFLYQLSAEQHALEAVCGRSVSAALITPTPVTRLARSASPPLCCRDAGGGGTRPVEDNAKCLNLPYRDRDQGR